jgi:prevent-host-death family protein
MTHRESVYNLGELRKSLGTVVKRAITHPSDDYLIAEHGHPIAAIVPIEELRRLRSIAEASAAGLTIIADSDGRPNVVLDEKAVAYFQARADAARARTA